MNLEDYESRIAKLAALEIDLELDDYDQPAFESLEAQACTELDDLAAEIGRIAWQPPYREWSRSLRDRATSAANRIATEHELVPVHRSLPWTS